MSKPLTITLQSEDWIEIACALETKCRRIRDGSFGPEDSPGEDKRWTTHLTAIREKIEKKLYAK